MARHDLDQILANGKVQRGYLGILPQDVTPAMAKAFNSESGRRAGRRRDGEQSGGKGGLQKGDIVLAINGEAVADANQLRLKVGMLNPNEPRIESAARRRTQQIAVNLGEFPSTEERASIGSEQKESVLDGVTVENLTPEQANQLKLSQATKGVVVDEVSPASRAANAGLQPGDVIQEVNHHAVKSVGEFKQAVSSTSKDSPVLLLVNREGTTMFLCRP